MAIRVRADGTTTNVDNVSAKGITIVKRVTVGKPVRKINAAVVNIDNIDGVDTSGAQDSYILIYNASNQTWEAQENTAVSSINALDGVDTSSKVDGSVLVYNASSGNFETTTVLEEQTINGGQY